MRNPFRPKPRHDPVETLYPPVAKHHYQSDDSTNGTAETIAKPVEPPKRRRHQGLRDGFSVLLVIIGALVLALVLIGFVFQSYQVSGISMENTLQNSDRLIVWKVPRTWARITGHPYIPNRGNVVIFNESNLDYTGESPKQLIKRVIGLPGDRIVVKHGQVTIYNAAHPNGFSPKENQPPLGKGITPTNGTVDVTLKKNQIFVMGDNRPDSLDSRIFGPVDANNIIGKLVVRVLPVKNFELF